jgi:hypothetical protein
MGEEFGGKRISMKKLIYFICLFLLAGTTLALAQMGGPMMGSQQGEEEEYSPYGRGYGMGPGMMGGWCGGPGYGMGPGMMYGQGGPGYGMGPGMMHGWGRGPGSKAYQKFLDETKDLRKKLHMKMFDFIELIRSGADKKKIEKAEEEIYRLRKMLYKKYMELFEE